MLDKNFSVSAVCFCIVETETRGTYLFLDSLPPLHPHPTTGKKKSCHPQGMYKWALAVSTSESLTFLVAFPQWAECSHISFNKYLKAFIH